MKIIVYSRKQIIMTSKGISIPHIIISIRAPDEKEVNFETSGKCRGVLRLKFHDAEKRIEKQNLKLFTSEQARQIIDFVERYSKEDSDFLIVAQCEGGISRSAGLAAALAKIYLDDDKEFFRHYTPNSLVYRTILNEWFGKLI